MKTHAAKLKSTVFLMLLILLVFRSNLAINGAKEGLALCLQVVIPSIFPFLFISAVLSSNFSFRVLGPLCRITGVPDNAQHILILGIIGGYPIGAQAVANAKKDGIISDKCAERLLGFCNNTGPAFIFGLLGAVLEHKFAPILLWLIHIGSALMIGCTLPDKHAEKCEPDGIRKSNITAILRSSVTAMSLICGWVIIFRVLLSFLKPCVSGVLPGWLIVLMSGILELSNGCVALNTIDDPGFRFLCASIMLSLGGFCVFLQTHSVTSGIKLNTYLYGKLLQAVLSVCFSLIVVPFLYQTRLQIIPLIITVLAIIVLAFPLFKKNSSIMQTNNV